MWRGGDRADMLRRPLVAEKTQATYGGHAQTVDRRGTGLRGAGKGSTVPCDAGDRHQTERMHATTGRECPTTTNKHHKQRENQREDLQ